MAWLPKCMSAALLKEDSISSTVTPSPRCVVGVQAGISSRQKALVHKITSGVANTAYQLLILSDLNIGFHMISTGLERSSLKLSARQNRPLHLGACRPHLPGALALCAVCLEQVSRSMIFYLFSDLFLIYFNFISIVSSLWPSASLRLCPFLLS